MAGDQLIRPAGEPTRRDWIAVMSVMLGAFMAVLDIQITNSSLKDIQGALSATLEEGSWISTSYLVAEIIMIPLTAWLVQLLSARRLAVWVSLGFCCLAAVLDGLEPGEHDRLPRLARLHRRRADPAGVHPDPDQTSRTPPRQGHGHVRHDRHLRPVDRPDPGRLADGKLGLGIHLLHQHPAGA
jgi:hypothetical protein